MQSWAVSPIQYLLRQKISIVDTFVFVFVSIIKITKVFVIVSISHIEYLRYVSSRYYLFFIISYNLVIIFILYQYFIISFYKLILIYIFFNKISFVNIEINSLLTIMIYQL